MNNNFLKNFQNIQKVILSNLQEILSSFTFYFKSAGMIQASVSNLSIGLWLKPW